MSPGPTADGRSVSALPADRPVSWTIIVALKAMPAAKSRLMPASAGPREHAQLVEAIRSDTLAVASSVGQVLVVLDRPGDDSGRWPVLVQREAGLNAAVREGETLARTLRPDDAVAALVGDLPALTTSELTAALTIAATHPRAFVADAAGTGTTLLTARPGVLLQPAFGPGSATRHATIAHNVAAGPGLRLDVDTAADLARARELGVGPATRALLDW
jgi:2-phospho-L-lactate/phosphoenolpyruvate guanylyltransferase